LKGAGVADIDKLIKKCRNSTLKMRPVLPLGQPMELGMVGVLDDGAFRYRGKVRTMLGQAPGKPLAGDGSPSIELISGKDVELSAHAGGETSEAFGDIAKAKARIEVSLDSKNSFLVAAHDIAILNLPEPERLLTAMLRAYGAGLWLKNYCFVYQIAVPSSFQAILSHQAGAKVLLSASGDVGQGPVSLGDVSVKLNYERQRGELEQLIASKPTTAFFNAYAVKPHLFKPASVKTASALAWDDAADEIKGALAAGASPFVRV
jgi:hypothetical protein